MNPISRHLSKNQQTLYFHQDCQTMASSVGVIPAANQHHMDRLDAARALLGVAPAPETSSPNTSRLSASSVSFVARTYQQQPTAQHSQEPPRATPPLRALAPPLDAPLAAPRSAPLAPAPTLVSAAPPKPQVFQLAPPAVISNGLDALAALASSEQASWEQQRNLSSSSDEEDAEAMPPPPPRGRRRSVSNPEGMDKWRPSRRHFVLPASILEEELAEASAAMERKNSMDNDKQQQAAPISGLMSEEEQANLSPEELLKRARSRLLEDLSEGSLNGEKGVLTLPHSLSKYKEVRKEQLLDCNIIDRYYCTCMII